MPTYDYHCDTCGLEIEVKKSIKNEEEERCPACYSIMLRCPGMGIHVAFNTKGSVADHKESEHKKKVKDPERALRNRKKLLGHDEVPTPSMKTDPRHIIKKGRTLGGQQNIDVDKSDLIKASAKDPVVVQKCIEALKKSENK